MLKQLKAESVTVDLCVAKLEEIEPHRESELDEMWSFVGNKSSQRWLWHAIERRSGKILAYVLGRRKDEVFIELKALLIPFGISRFDTDDWGAYERHYVVTQLLGERQGFTHLQTVAHSLDI